MRKPRGYLTKPLNTRKKGKQGEDSVRNTISSGGLWFDKGDLKMKDYLIEVKNKQGQKGYMVSTKLLDKVLSEAYTVKKEPLIIILFDKYEVVCRIRVK